MSLTVSNTVKPIVQQYLSSLSHLVDVAQKFSKEKELEDSVLLQSRLAPDMNPLIWQLQMVSEFAARCVARLAEIEVPNYENTETTFEQLQTRITKAMDYVANVDDEALNTSLQRVQTVPLGPDKSMEFRGPIYLTHFFLPNFYFHITTAYNILRHNGVAIGKLDFIGDLPA
jgi:hypothetical protein